MLSCMPRPCGIFLGVELYKHAWAGRARIARRNETPVQTPLTDRLCMLVQPHWIASFGQLIEDLSGGWHVFCSYPA